MKEGETKVSDISNEDPSDWRELFPFFNACVGALISEPIADNDYLNFVTLLFQTPHDRGTGPM